MLFIQGRRMVLLEAGTGGGIGFGLCSNMEEAIIKKETVIAPKAYHTVYEAKNGQGPATN